MPSIGVSLQCSTLIPSRKGGIFNSASDVIGLCTNFKYSKLNGNLGRENGYYCGSKDAQGGSITYCRFLFSVDGRDCFSIRTITGFRFPMASKTIPG